MKRIICFLAVLALTSNLLPKASASLIAYEGFDYPVGGIIPGQSGGSGWANAWQVNGTPAGGSLVTSGSLGYTDSQGNSLVTSGNQAFFTGAGGTSQPNRDLLNALGADGTTAWLSFLGIRVGPTTNGANPYPRAANFSLFNSVAGGEQLAIGNSTGAPLNNWALIPDGSLANIQSSTFPFDQLSFIVVRIDFLPGNDNAYLFVNPLLNAEPGIGSAAAASIGAFDFSFNRARPFAGNPQPTSSRPHAELSLDEIRIGDLYSDVTPFVPVPEPASIGLLALSLMGVWWALRRKA